MVNIQELISREIMRGDCYRLLSACFYQPQKEAFIHEELFRDLEGLLREVSPGSADHAAVMEKAFTEYSEEALLVDYARLFVGPNELIAPPYGSVYLDGEKKVMGDSTMEVLRIYEDSGLIFSEDFKELPDHVAVELEFMYYLIYKETDAMEKGDMDSAQRFLDIQGSFMEKFLKQWINKFCEKIKEGTDNRFYLALAECVSSFIANPPIQPELLNISPERSMGH